MKNSSLVCAAVLALCGWNSQAQPADRQAADRANTVLGPDDSINVLALNCEEISKEWRIGASGDVSFPMIGRVHLASLTVEQAEREIAGKLKRYLNDPQVSVFPTERRSRPITVAGAVEKPGRYQIAASTTLLDALIIAGGPKMPGPTITVKRRVSDGVLSGSNVKMDRDGSYTMIELELKSVMDGSEGPGPNADFQLQPMDVITISPPSAPRYVHIVGDVTHPGSVELVTQDTVSLMKVVAVAGGLTRTASADNTVIMHISADGVQTSTAVVNLKQIMQGKSKDLDLIAGDIVMVPSSKLKTISQAMSSTALSSGLSTVIFTLARF